MWLFGNSEQPLFDLLLFLLSSLLFCEKKRSKLGVSKEGKGARVEVKWMLGREENGKNWRERREWKELGKNGKA